VGELVDLGVKAGIVEKSGAWFSYNGERIGQGRENTKAFLKEHAKIAAELEKAIRQNAGLIVDKMLQAPPEGDEAKDAEEGPDEFLADEPEVETAGKKGARAKR
jgi:recombination protein RecA